MFRTIQYPKIKKNTYTFNFFIKILLTNIKMFKEDEMLKKQWLGIV